MKHLECSCSLPFSSLSLSLSSYAHTQDTYTHAHTHTHTHTHTQVLKRITMTRSATTSLATSTALLEKSSGASADRRHCGRVCGITQLVCAKGGVILNKMKSTGQEVVFKRSENEPEKTTQPQHPDVLPFSCTFSHQPAFFKATPFTKGSTLCTF